MKPYQVYATIHTPQQLQQSCCMPLRVVPTVKQNVFKAQPSLTAEIIFSQLPDNAASGKPFAPA